MPKEQLRRMIEDALNESNYQTFLENNRQFIPTSFMLHHGIHYSILFKKYPIFEEFETDFLFITKSSVTWRAVLIEIEKPQSRIFTDDGRFHGDFLRAKDQILNWKSKLRNQAHLETFKSNFRALFDHMYSNELELKYILIHGRRVEYGGDQDRIAKIKSDLGEDVQFMSYDSLLDLNTPYFSYLAKKAAGRTHLIDFDGNPLLASSALSLPQQDLKLSTSVHSKIINLVDVGRLPIETGLKGFGDSPDSFRTKIGKLSVGD